MKKTIWMLSGVLALALAAMSAPAVAQGDYPSSPVRLVLGFEPGGSSDVIGRILAQKLSAQMNGNVIMDYKPGASSHIGAEFVARSKPDGYTLFLSTPSVILSLLVGEKPGYDLFKDLNPVALVASVPYILLVHPSLPVNTPAEFITFLRANPDKVIYSSAGTGSSQHLVPLMFLQTNGLTALHVPFKGAAPAMTDLVSGRSQFGLATAPLTLPMLKAKRVKALAVTSLKRMPILPDVPTLAETIMPGFETGSWLGVMAPAKIPPAIVKRLNGEIVRAVKGSDMESQLAQRGLNVEMHGSTPEELGAYIRYELDRWTKVTKR